MPRTLPIVSSPVVDSRDLRVMLINPPQSYPFELRHEYQSYFPTGLAYLAAAAEATGASVTVTDCLAYDEVIQRDDLVWFGMSLDELRSRITSLQPHVVGIANPFSMFIADTIRVAELVKSASPSSKVVVGGIEASVAPNNRRLIDSCRAIDVLVKGEGEHTFVELLSKLDGVHGEFADLQSVRGILFREADGTVVETEKRAWIRDLDTLPMPAYHLLDMDRMFANPRYAIMRGRVPNVRCLPVHTSRGCPYSCTFCSVHAQVGKANRRHTPELVVRHIEHLRSTYGVQHFHFEDDNLTINPKQTVALLKALRPLGITFDTPNGIRADTVTPEIAQLFKEAGATSITIAVESGVQRILDEVVCKALSLRDVVTAASSLDAVDIPCAAFFIVGFPGEAEADIRGTLRFAKQLTREHHTINLLFVADPLPGTPLYEQCARLGYLVGGSDKETLFRGIRLNQAPRIATPEFTKRELFEWAREELDVSDMLSVGLTMPVFVSNSARGRNRISRFMKSSRVPRYPWRRGYLPLRQDSPQPA